MKQCRLLTVLLGLCGCASGPTPRQSPLVPSEALRANLGRIGVWSAPASPSGEWDMPTKGAAEGAKRGALMGGAFAVPGFLFPVGFLLGGIAGAVAAEPVEVVEEAESTVKSAFAEIRLAGALRDRVVRFARTETPYAVARQEDVAKADTTAERPKEPAEALDTALQIRVPRYGTMPGGLAPPNPRQKANAGRL